LAHRTLSSFALFFRRVSPGKIIRDDQRGVNGLFRERTTFLVSMDGLRIQGLASGFPVLNARKQNATD
jgi:hypothetical protein